MTNNDMDLVREYARCKSEEAFGTLVARHVNLVYSVAMRQTGDVHLAKEITQTVFIILARKAGSLSSNTVVSGWLCQTARYASAKALSTQRRRQLREQEAYMQSLSHEPDSAVWAQIAPLLDTAMAQLGEKDHNALVIRYFEGRNFKDISVALGTSEAGAKMRVNRALEKLRKFFGKRGLTFSVATLAGAVSAHSVQAAPVGLATSVTVSAIKGTAVTASTLTLIKTTLKIMAWTKVKTAAVAGVIVLLAAGTATVVIHSVATPTASIKQTAKPSKFAFAGYTTPEASIQSMLWAGSNGDFEKFVSSTTPEQMDRFRNKMAGKSADEIRHECVAWANALVGYKITQKEVVSDEEVHLHITAPASSEGLRDGSVTIIMKKMGAEWKQAGDL